MSKIRVGLYPRVSSKEQLDGYSIDEQIEKLTKYCEAMDWTIYRVYPELGYTGANTKRPALQAMLKDVRSGALDKVVVYKLDRISRSQKDTMFLIEDEFLANGVDFVSISENFDTSTPFGRAMIGILAVFAQLERENIKERTMMGKEARAKSGKWHGSKWVPIGYDYDPDPDSLNVNEFEAIQVREIYDLFLKGTPLREIERLFNDKGYKHKYGPWDPKTMRRVMRNRTNIGYIKHNDDYFKGVQEPIIDEETFNNAQRLLDQRTEAYEATGIRPGAQTTFLGGLLFCKQCGGKYAKTRGGSSKYGVLDYYACYSRSKKVKKMIKDPECKNRYWRVDELDRIIFDEIKKLAFDPEYINELKAVREDPEPDTISILKREIESIDNQISRFMDLYGVGKFSIEQVSAKVDPLNERRLKLLKDIDALSDESGKISEDEAIAIAESFEDIIDNGEFVIFAVKFIFEDFDESQDVYKNFGENHNEFCRRNIYVDFS